MKLINEEQVLGKWKDVVLEATELDYSDKLEKNRVNWMCKYAHFHDAAVNESAELGNIPDIGNPTFPGYDGSGSFNSVKNGSGDTPDTSLAISLQVARQTVGFDLLPVVPMDSSFTMLTYFDTVYAGGRMDTQTAPVIVEMKTGAGDKADFDTAIGALTEGDAFTIQIPDATTPVELVQFKYLGRSRINRSPILQTVKLLGENTLASVSDGADVEIKGGTGETFSPSFELVNAFENHITGFSGADFMTDEPYSRDEGMNTPNRTLGLQMYSTSVRAGTYQVDTALKWEQLQDMPRAGLSNPYEMAQTAVMNELTQSINKYILSGIAKLANKHAAEADNVSHLATLTLTDQGATGFAARDIGHEKRKVYSRILAVSNMIANKGGRGAANTAVTNVQVATIIQDINGFNAYTGTNTVSQESGDLYPLGSVGNVNVFVDPYMDYDDNTVYVFRRGDGESPGLVFMPYLLAESVSIIAENTMAPKMAMKSRFALVEAGHNPHIYYYAFEVANAQQYV